MAYLSRIYVEISHNCYFFTVELSIQKLLQPAFSGSVSCICPELHSPILQSKEVFFAFDLHVFVIGKSCC